MDWQGEGRRPMDAEGFIRAMKDIVAGCGAAGEGEDDSGASVRTPGSPGAETAGKTPVRSVRGPPPPSSPARSRLTMYGACSRPQPLGRCDLLPQRDCGRFARPSSHRKKKGKNEGFLRPGWAARQCFGVWP